MRSREGEEQLLITDIPLDRLFHEKGRRMQGSPTLYQEMVKLMDGAHGNRPLSNKGI